MLLGLISDVHCNVEAFDHAVGEMAPEVDEILLMGDAVYEYRFSNEVVGAARRLGMRYILGNHEMVLLGPHGERARSAPTVDPVNVAYLRDLPLRIDVRLGGKRVCMVHGSPWAPYDEYLYAGGPTLARCSELDLDILLLGHTHVPMVQRVGRTLVVNPGSLGESREPGVPRPVSYAVLDTTSEEVEVRRFPNPRFGAMAAAGS
jgi:putative phosphoesterase